MTFKNAHFLSAEQLTPEKIKQVFELALKLEALSRGKKTTRILQGAVLANLFFEPSTRTRLSFEVAFKLLGGAVLNVLESDSSSLVKGESLYDMTRVVNQYADVIVVRHPEEAAIKEIAEASEIPILNAGNGTGEHPSQALIDLYTIFKEVCQAEFEKLNHLKICLVGDLKHGRTVHSLIKLLNFFEGIKLHLVSPLSLKMPEAIISSLKKHHPIFETEHLKEGVEGSDVIYMTRIQEERFASQAEFSRYAGSYSIDKDFYEAHCKPHAILMHPMPRDSRLTKPEIQADLNTHPQLAMFRQSGNAVPIRMALFCLTLGIEEKIFDHLTDPLF